MRISTHTAVIGSLTVTLALSISTRAVAENLALAFDGEDDYVSIPSGFDTPEGTFECWFTPLDGSPASDDRWFGHTYNQSTQGFRGFFWQGDSAPLTWYNDPPDFGEAFQCATSRDTWQVGQTYHVAGTWTQSLARVFVNGRLENELPISEFLTGSSELTFGAATNGGPRIYVNCGIDEVRIWDVAREEHEIRATRDVPLTGNEPGLVGYYRLDDCGGSMVVDSSPSGLDASVIGDPDCVPSNVLNLALDFDGEDDYVSIPSAFDTPEGTFECWFTPLDGSPASDDRWFGHTYNQSTQGFRGFFWQGDSAPLTWYNDPPDFGEAFQCATSRDTWQVGQTYHVAGTWTQSLARVFVNGRLEKQCSISGFLTGSSELTFGAATNGGPRIYVNCGIDEVRIWDVAREEHEIRATRDVPLTGNEPGLVGYYRLDDCGGSMVVDSSPSGLHASVIGDPDCVPANGLCIADIDNDREVNFGDILAVLGAWGCTDCPEDIDGSGTVDFGDLIILLSSWGPCK